MLKVMTIVGTRPELIRLSRVIPLLDQHCDHRLVHTGQNYDYELNQIFFEDLGIRTPDRFLEAAGKTAAETIGRVIIAADAALEEDQPDAVLILGDTNSCIAAIPAKRRKIPVFHMEAGNRCFDQRVPEEINRRIVDSIADINMTYSSIAREYLLREGFPPDQVIKTGSPIYEVLMHHRSAIDGSDVLDRLGLKSGEFFVVSAHREENIESDRMFEALIDIVNAVAEKHQLPVILSTHPRTRKKLDATGATLHPLVQALKPLGFRDYVKLQCEARATLSDSGTISEESSIMNFPALNLREAHERPEAMEQAAVMMTGLDLDRVLQGLEILSTQGRGVDRTLLEVADYVAPNLSEKVLRIILSYTGYVNRVVWKRYQS
ncbi:UDP-N-acetylglucosamine 2-epimerase (non-hydrolysing) [Sphingomonas naasensis]|nr:UDP-N-acetylglucosamine 2-epimerase (non-hydrolyzing) [Sphingomonas naasensis]NIJ19314.1 UDP-N-acetylglucosamine 2-epimerase (non-hydrolysing) [Sphingomonas naasensis]